MKKSVQRFREIVKVLAYYGFGYLVDSKKNRAKRFPQNLRRAFEELGPTFIKIGQILSTRPDIISDAYIKELSKLQDDVPAESYDTIETIFNSEFHKTVEETFEKFNKKPLACASIAQVHEAILKDGTKVIVKIQRPNIEEKMKLDLSILYKLASLTKARFTDFIINPTEALDEISMSTKMELDFNTEAKNIEHFKELNKDVSYVTCPYIFKELSTKHILTMEKIDGFKIDNIKKLAAENYDLNDLGKKLALTYFKQVFQDGFFHGDPHPGNILLRDKQICFIDFGLMGNLSKNLKNALNDMILSVAYYDIDKIISVIMAVGIRHGYVDRNQLYEDIDYIFSSYLSASLENIKISQFLQEVFDCAKRNNISLPKDLIILVRSCVILEGVIAKISPDISILDVAIPFVKSQNNDSILKNFNVNEALLNSYLFLKNSSKLPSKIIELSNGLMRGRAKIQFNIKNIDEPISEINKMVNRVVLALIISSMIISSSLILHSNIGPKMYGMSIIGITGYGIAAILGFWLLISIIRSKKL
ncbi:ABC1 kinase family protein [Clostridium neuense]|uniref:ABC1 kinase family protein n=1 Tax=Clostridium neuense TaxID=1728934 RepID=A0ABW8TIM2_9CLOT